MGLESFSYITSLNSSNPVHATDQVSQGDDHIRGVKLTLLQSFPNVNAAVNFTPTEANNLVGSTGQTGTGNLVLSASPTFTGTVTAATVAAATITATTIAGITATNLLDKTANETISGNWAMDDITVLSIGNIPQDRLVDKAATETITGAWTFTQLDGGAMTATSYDGVAAANLVDKSASETISGAWSFDDFTLSGEFTTTGRSNVSTTGTINALATANVAVIRMTGSAQVTLNGMAGGADGKRVIIINQTSAVLLLNTESGSATAANRLRFAGSASISVDDAFEFIYDGADSRWQLVAF